MKGPLALGCAKVSKTFNGIRALRDVALEVGEGEIHALLGQNGSGKSTLIKILTGVHEPDPGAQVVVWGQQVDLPVQRPQDLGIAVIHQDLGLGGQMTVLENLGMASGFGTSAFAPIDWRSERRTAEELMARLGHHVPLDALVDDLTAADRAITAILRASRSLGETSGHQLFILDEPTAYLNAAEADRLHELMRNVAANGDSVLFISHFLPEVLEVCERVTVLRDGAVVGSGPVEGLSEADLVEMMLDREMDEFYPDPPHSPQEEQLLGAHGVRGGTVERFDLRLRRGEIVGLTGLAGSGYEQVPYLLSGATARSGGEVAVEGAILSDGVRDAVAHGVVLVPSNRPVDGIWPDATAAENLSLPILGRYFRRGVLVRADESRQAGRLMGRYLVKPPEPELPLSSFSGGNQQKVVLAKWLQEAPKVLLLDEPTQGVDAGARHDILELIRQSVTEGAAALLCSSDHEQLAAVCNRVLVMDAGVVVDELTGMGLSENAIVMSCQSA